MSNKSLIQKLGERSWDEISDEWLGFIPNIGVPGEAPSPGVTGLFEQFFYTSPPYDTDTYPINIVNLKESILHEAIYSAHKACNILRLSHNNFDNGYTSWSMFDSYHCSYIAAKSILSFFGISFPQPNGVQAFVDIFWYMKDKKAKPAIRANQKNQIFYKKIPQLDQALLWEFFARLIRVSRIDICSPNVYEAIKSLDHSDIRRLRNKFLYNHTFWLYDDLFTPTPSVDPNFTMHEIDFASDKSSTLKTALCLTNIAIKLIRSLSTHAPIIKREYDILVHNNRTHCPTITQYLEI